MKTKKLITLLMIPFLASSCVRRSDTTEGKKYDVYSLSTGYFSTTYGKTRIVSDSSIFLSPFNTVITGKVLSLQNTYQEKDYQDMSDFFSDTFSYYHALLDRHYNYRYYEDKNETNDDRNYLNNVKVINDSYGSEKPIAVDPFLYDVLKQSYEFTLNSDLKFNMFLGTLNEVYEEKISSLQKDMSSLDVTMTLLNKATFANDFEEEKIKEIVNTLPNTKEEVQSLLSFDDTNKTVTFHRLKKAEKLEISLGGNGKGFATEEVSKKMKQKYKDISMSINSGTSSLKAVGERPDGKEWNIVYSNPVYNETMQASERIVNPYNPYEVALKIKGEFNISTSGYYEQYFYVYDGDDLFRRRCHIVDSNTGYSHQYFDQISVLIDNTGLADMYTTALMNTDSVEECNSLFDKLNRIYDEKDASLILCYKTEGEDSDKAFSYRMSDIKNTYTLNGKTYPSITLPDKSEYRGDYSDFDSALFFKDNPAIIDSKVVRNFRETYKVSKNLKDSIYLLDPDKYPTYVTNRDNIISRIEAEL